MPISSRPDDTRALLAFLRAPQVGAARLAAVIAHHGSPLAALRSGERGWRLAGLPAEAVAWLRAPDTRRLEADLAWLAEPDHHLLAHADPRYPERLRQLADAPPGLFLCGDPEWLSLPMLSMVGSRNASAAGLDCARDFAATLAGHGLVIVSGLALGIDGAAHAGALAAGGITLAVCGTGLDCVYPAAHRELARRIATQGALLSEFPPGTPPRRSHFPRRNRLIAALSLGTLVVEASLASGSLITARLAAEFGAEVYAIPGSIMSPTKRGCHRLIREGAKLVETSQDVLEEIGPALAAAGIALAMRQAGPGLGPPPRQEGGPHSPPGSVPVGADDNTRRTLASLGQEPASADELAQRSGLAVGVLQASLTLLEIAGVVRSIVGGRWQRMAGGGGRGPPLA